MLLDTELQEIVESTIEDIAVHLAADAVYFADVGVLPHLPFAWISELVLVVTGYPERVLVEDGSVEMGKLEVIAGINDGTHTIVPFDNLEPGEDIVLELAVGERTCLLNVEDGRKVTLLQLHLINIILCLPTGITAGDIEMVGSGDDVHATGLGDVVLEIDVLDGDALCGLADDEAEGITSELRLLELCPVNALLVVGDIDASHLVSSGFWHGAELGTPTDTEGTDEDVIEHKGIECGNDDAGDPQQPRRGATQEAQQAILLFLATTAPALRGFAARGCLAYGFPALCAGHEKK